MRKVARDEIPLIVLLLRHGESTANVDPAVYESTPDHAIPLSERGQRMTDIAGATRTYIKLVDLNDFLIHFLDHLSFVQAMK